MVEFLAPGVRHAVPLRPALKAKNPLGLAGQRAEECVVSESLCTPQRAGRMAVVMMRMAMMIVVVRGECGPRKHRVLKVNETCDTVNRMNCACGVRVIEDLRTHLASDSQNASARWKGMQDAAYFLPRFMVIFRSTATPNLPFGNVSTRTTSAT